MPLTQREYDEEELRSMERRLADLEYRGQQGTLSARGRKYRASLERDIARLRERLSSPDDGAGAP